MSLINDALKQAGQAQKQNPPPPSPLQFRATDESPRRNYTPPAILFGVLLIVLALGGVMVVFALKKNPDRPEVVNARELPAPSPATESPAVAPAKPALISQPDAPAAPATATNPLPVPPPAVATNNIAPAPVEPPKPATLKLQGISFNPSRPSAVVSGRTVYVGDRVLGFSVTGITKDAVTFSNGPETKVLSLSD